MKKKEPHVVADFIAWNELNGLFGRVMTILDAVVDYRDTDHKEGVKSLVSSAIFAHDYKDVILFNEEHWDKVKELAFYYHETK